MKTFLCVLCVFSTLIFAVHHIYVHSFMCVRKKKRERGGYEEGKHENWYYSVHF